jgi:hypothetical protein
MKTFFKKPFNSRKFVSVGLFFTLASLVVTGILIQIFETFENGFPMHFCTAVHVLTGMVFAVFSVLHTVTNWRSLKTHIKHAKGATLSREATVALFLVMIIVVIGFLLAYNVF